MNATLLYRYTRLILQTGCIGLPAMVSGLASAPTVASANAFERCAACHSVTPGESRVGPSLGDVIGRHAGTGEGFRYSPAMRRSGIVWNEQTLDLFLKDPQQAVPGNRMAFSGVDNAEDRAAIIDFLRRHSQAK
ncbi:c-type cytochrome [Paraburkholderia sp. BCC1886]|uniref:c-type cytochrome n=1 Tax=Paraburkholderia sp. BCC1886 TaxID=2562670 RepID=UPI001182AEB1|nr:cytochrome c family protein [Paraburkholderia sp. BCC1886]